MFILHKTARAASTSSFNDTIVEEIRNVHQLGQDYTLNKLHSLLKNDMWLTESITKICDCVKDSDLFSYNHQGPMRSLFSRAETFKKMFKYIYPIKVHIRK